MNTWMKKTGIGLSISHSIIGDPPGYIQATPNDVWGYTSSFAAPCTLEAIPRKNQYQSTMDALHRMPHYPAMEFLKDGSRNGRPLLSVVDDDESMRESLPDLIKEFGFAARAFSSAEEFLSSRSADETSCLILDIAMPGMSGPDLHQELKRRGKKIPVIFITGQKDEAIRARAFEQGAAGFLLKPFGDTALLAAIKTALQAI
jgi:CheY-like chemotaxis protein